MDMLIKIPTKEQVRQYLDQRVADHTPPPSLEDIRKQLGWKMIEVHRRRKLSRNGD
jgi:hypothetical protein